MTRFANSTRGMMTSVLVVLAAASAAANPGDQASGGQVSRQGQAQGGPLLMQPVSSGAVFTPEVKFTTVNHAYGTLVGGYGGWLYDDSLLVGGAAYWLTNGENGTDMWYGGMLVGWTVPLGSVVRVGGRGLVGFGYAELPYQVQLRQLRVGTPSRRRSHDDGVDLDRHELLRLRTAGDGCLPPDEDGVVRCRRRLSGDCRRQRPRPGAARRLRQRRDQVRTVLVDRRMPARDDHASALSPPLKWAGGKRWQLPRLRTLWQAHSDRRLVEPFCGGLAVSLGLAPDRALLNDINPHLVNFYRWPKRGLAIDLPDAERQRHVYYAYRAPVQRAGGRRQARHPRGGHVVLLPEPDRLQWPLPVQWAGRVQRPLRTLHPHPLPAGVRGVTSPR